MNPLDFDSYGGRRFLMCVGVLVAVTGLRAWARLSDDAYMWIVLGVVNGYIAGNVTQRVKAPEPPPAPGQPAEQGAAAPQ